MVSHLGPPGWLHRAREPQGFGVSKTRSLRKPTGFSVPPAFPFALDELQSVDPVDVAPYGFGATRLDLHPCGLVLAVSINGAVPRVNATPSSHALVVAFGTRPPQSSLRLRGARLRRLHRRGGRLANEWPPDLRIHRLTGPSAASAQPLHCCRCLPARTSGLASPSGPFDACQPALTRPSERPCGRSPTDRSCLPRFRSCRESASHISDWSVHGHHSLQRFLPARRRTTLSDRAVLHAVPHLAVSRLRGFQPSSGCVHRLRRCSHRRRVAPLLVVSPLRG